MCYNKFVIIFMIMKKFGEISMIQFAVSSDSTCDLYKDYIEKREIWFAPLTFTLEKNGKQEEGRRRVFLLSGLRRLLSESSGGFFPPYFHAQL